MVSKQNRQNDIYETMCSLSPIWLLYTVKPVLNCFYQKDRNCFFKTDYTLMFFLKLRSAGLSHLSFFPLTVGGYLIALLLGTFFLLMFQIVITYGDRIVEKKHVPEEVVKVVNNMLRGDYSCLTKEAQRILPVGPR